MDAGNRAGNFETLVEANVIKGEELFETIIYSEIDNIDTIDQDIKNINLNHSDILSKNEIIEKFQSSQEEDFDQNFVLPSSSRIYEVDNDNLVDNDNENYNLQFSPTIKSDPCKKINNTSIDFKVIKNSTFEEHNYLSKSYLEEQGPKLKMKDKNNQKNENI